MSKGRTDDESGLVYSTQHGKMCPACGKPFATCACPKAGASPTGDGIVRVSLATRGRRGKSVTLISGVPLALAELKILAKQLKQKIGSGGTIKDNIIEIQGDHRDRLVAELEKLGYSVKRAGG